MILKWNHHVLQGFQAEYYQMGVKDIARAEASTFSQTQSTKNFILNYGIIMKMMWVYSSKVGLKFSYCTCEHNTAFQALAHCIQHSAQYNSGSNSCRSRQDQQII